MNPTTFSYSPAFPMEGQLEQLQSGQDNKLNNASSVGATVSATATARMKTYAVGTVNVAQQTRHARRIYVGGIPSNFIDEDGLRAFLNSVVAQGLTEENDHSYVLSVYINHKKCFAFVELKSIELATACLALDGIMLKNVALRILRANEYKPELVPAAMNKVINFDLSGFQFGNPVASSGGGLHHTDSDEGFTDRTFDSLIQANNFLSMESGTMVIVGYPYDENPKKTVIRGTGSAALPKALRNMIRKFKYGVVDNAEYNSDLSKLRVLDVGDILGGKVVDECRANLTAVVSELLRRGGMPVIIGGSNDLLYPSVKGATSVAKVPVSVISLGSKVDGRLLDDFVQSSVDMPEEVTGEDAQTANIAFDTYVLFGAQGNVLPADEARNFIAKGGRLLWLQKDLRQNTSRIETQFVQLLEEISPANSSSGVIVHIDCGSLDCSVAAFANNTNSTAGYSYDEILQIAYYAGLHPTVSMIQLTEFSPAAEETRQNMFVLEVLYYFSLGYNLRIDGSIENFVSPLGISFTTATTTTTTGESEEASAATEADFATRLTSMVPPSTSNIVSSGVNNAVYINDSSLPMIKACDELLNSCPGAVLPGNMTSAASTASSSAMKNNGIVANNGTANGVFPSSFEATDVSMLLLQQQLQQQQLQQQQQLVGLNRTNSTSAGTNMRQQFLAMRTQDNNTSNSSNNNNNNINNNNTANNNSSAVYGRTLLEMKVASGKIPYLIAAQQAQAQTQSLSNDASPVDAAVYYANNATPSSSSTIGANTSNNNNLLPGRATQSILRNANMMVSSNSPNISSQQQQQQQQQTLSQQQQQQLYGSLSRSTSSRSVASSSASQHSSANNLLYLSPSATQVLGSRSNSSLASNSAHSLLNNNSSSLHSLTPSPNTSNIMLLASPTVNAHPVLSHPPLHPNNTHHYLPQQQQTQQTTPHSMLRRGLCMHEPLNQSSIDLGQDPHPFDETTDLNFDLSTVTSMNHNNSNNNPLLMSKVLPSANGHNASNNSYTNEFLLLNASTKSNGNSSGIGFASVTGSTDTTMTGAVFPQVTPYLTSMDVSYSPLLPAQSQAASSPMGLMSNNSFYTNNNSNNNNNNISNNNNGTVNGNGLPGFLGFVTNKHMDLSTR